MCNIKNHPTLSYRLINNVTGWVAFVVASITYILTVEPTASLWDCGEFITTSVGLQVGHPPGAPLFMIISRLFAIFAPSPETQSYMINIMSALCSGFTILFLFWTITHLAKKVVVKEGEECSMGQLCGIMGAGLVGALTYTFTDTFWFSAVEGEVYAMSSLITAVVFWAILKWENVAFQPYANRWLIFIAYMVGLSIGVHLLNLLVIPAIVFIYYFKKYETTKWGIIKSAALSIVILGVIMWGIIPGVIIVAGWFELLFVNGFGMPFNTGVVIYALLLIAGLTFGIRYTLKHNHTVVNTILTCFVVMLIGYSCYAMVVIRSVSNPPIDENSPDNVFALLSYISRDQYGQEPLVYGPYFNAPVIGVEDAGPIYYQNEKTGKYDIVDHKKEVKYDPRFCTILPRMYSQAREPQVYYEWVGQPKGPVYMVDGQPVQKPSFGQNLSFMFRYQLGHMYFRYFMWNFSGRQNDIQGHGDFRYGNWISGIPFIDNILVGDQSVMPDTLKHDKANNKYYMLPFILGLLGMFYQYQRGKQGKKDFWVVMLLFFFTGIAIVLYLNQYPYQPRERDYAYAGSFYAFAIWIGFGVLYLWDLLQKKMDSRNAAIIVTAVCLFAVPVNMAAQNWDDHDRGGRYATIAHAKNYLSTCAPNAILFTYGDNDTFPLWYAQEVEGFRRDVRIVNLSLLAGDWYIDQMKRKAYESDGVPISFTKDQYHAGVRDFVTIEERVQQPFSMKEVMEFVASDRPETKSNRYQGGAVDFIPTRSLYIPVDKKKVLANGTVQPKDSALIVDRVEIQLKGSSLNKSQLMVLDILATNNWERPVYFGVGMGQDSYMGFDKYFQLEGAAYRVVPIKSENNEAYYDFGRINTEILYDNLMNKFVWGNIKDPKVNIDHFHDNTIAVMKYRNTFLRLAEQLMQEAATETRVIGDTIINEITDSSKIQEAVRVLDKSLEEIPLYQVPADFFLLNYISIYYAAGEKEKGNDLAWALALDNAQMLRYIGSLSQNRRKALENDERRSMQALQMLVDMARRNGENAFAQEIQDMVESTLSGRPVTSKRVNKNFPMANQDK